MNQNTGSIQTYAKKLISVDSSAPIEEVYTKMVAENISYVPIINHDGQSNKGVYRRKDLFEWFVNNPGKKIQNVPKKLFEKDPLPTINMETSLEDIMKLLHSSSAILIENNGKYTHFISPRVVANALEDYAARFLVYESLEKVIRKRIVNNNIDLSKLNDPSLNKSLPEDYDLLDFGQYITIISRKWSEMGLDHLDKNTVIGYLNNARKYRNALMHFRLSNEVQGIEDAERLLTLLQK